MNNFKSIIIAVILVCSISVLYGQQEPLYTQFLFNKLAFNPAYAGSKEVPSVALLNRWQWIGLDGAPNTQSLSAHAPFFNRRVGLGFSLTHDNIGDTDLNTFNLSYSYRIPIEKGTLSLGMNFNLNQVRVNYKDANIRDLFDTSIPNGNFSTSRSNIGLGLYYSNDDFFVGLSTPYLIERNEGLLPFMVDNVDSFPTISRHYHLMGGYVYDLNSSVKIYPSAIFILTDNAPMDLDMNLSFIFYNKFWAGVTYRLGDSIDAIFQYQINKMFRVGTSYDFTVSDLRGFNDGSIELFLEYNFFKAIDKLPNPRFF